VDEARRPADPGVAQALDETLSLQLIGDGGHGCPVDSHRRSETLLRHRALGYENRQGAELLGAQPERRQLALGDLAAEVGVLRAAGARFRNEIVSGQGGDQILLDDPSGNPIELFEPR
jgi:hypothetical protein